MQYSSKHVLREANIYFYDLPHQCITSLTDVPVSEALDLLQTVQHAGLLYNMRLFVSPDL